MGLLARLDFPSAKAGHPYRAVGEWKDLVFALVKQGKTYFLKSSQTSRERRFGIEILMLCANALCQNCKKLRFLRYSAKQNSWIVCRFLVCTAFAALVKQGKTYFLKSSQTSRERRFGIEILMPCANALCQNCKKLRFLR